jgi:hypothetical protein
MVLIDTQNGNYQNPYCAGIDGILEAYSRSLATVELWGLSLFCCFSPMLLGPTNFAPIVSYVVRLSFFYHHHHHHHHPFSILFTTHVKQNGSAIVG